jgi:ribosomal subunit interface protein
VQISVTARHLELPAEVRDFAHTRLEKLGRFAADLRSAHVIIGAERTGHAAEITVRVNGHELVVHESHEHARGAIELAADRMEEQLRRLKEKRIDSKQRHEGGRGLNGRHEPPAADGGDEA